MIRNQKFTRSYIENELQRLEATLPRRTRIFVTGGAAMAFYGLKEATKDIDVVVQQRTEFHTLTSALRSLGYRSPKGTLTVKYAKMRASAILENTDGFRWDIFERVIAGKLSLSKGMIDRSHVFLDKLKLHVRYLSKEDIFKLVIVVTSSIRSNTLEDPAANGIPQGLSNACCDCASAS